MRHRHWSRMVGVVLMRRSLRCMGRSLHTQASDDQKRPQPGWQYLQVVKQRQESSERHCAWSKAEVLALLGKSYRTHPSHDAALQWSPDAQDAGLFQAGGDVLPLGRTWSTTWPDRSRRCVWRTASALATTLTCDGSWTLFGLFAWERCATCQHLTGRLSKDRSARNTTSIQKNCLATGERIAGTMQTVKQQRHANLEGANNQ
jgi:hypothetical protein